MKTRLIRLFMSFFMVPALIALITVSVPVRTFAASVPASRSAGDGGAGNTGSEAQTGSDTEASSEPPQTESVSESETEAETESETEVPSGKYKLVTEKGKTWLYKDGKKVYGEHKVNGCWMYITKKNGAVKNRFYYFKNGKRLCYYDKKGRRLSGSYKINGVKCTFSKKNGSLTKGRTKLIQKYIGKAKGTKAISGIRGYTPSSSVKKRLKSAIRSVERGGRSVSFVMIDINTMKGVAYNANKKYYSASSIKGPVVVSVVADKPSVLSSRKGTIRSILKYSDNSAYIGFAKRYGFGHFNKWVKKASAKYKRSGGNRCYGYFSAKNMAKIWMQNYDYFNSSSTGRKLGNMFESPAVSAIHSTLKSKYTTRSKAGWIAMGGKHSVTNDSGIVYTKKGNYIISIFSSVPSNMGRLNTLVRALDYTHNQMIK